MVPIRSIIESIGGNVSWDGQNQKVTLDYAGNKIELVINSNELKLNNESKTIDTPALIINNRTMIPIRFVAEYFGANVDWNDQSKSVSIVFPADQKENTYSIIPETFLNGKISIKYPKLTNLKDTKKQDQINTLIKTEALKIANVSEDELDKTKTIIEANYQIKLKHQEYLSIRFDGYSYIEGNIHQNKICNAINIDLKNMKLIQLSDILNIDSNLISLYKSGNYIPQEYLDLISLNQFSSVLESLEEKYLIESFSEKDHPFYMTYKSIGIVSYLPYALGSILDLEIPYSKLTDTNIKKDTFLTTLIDDSPEKSKTCKIYLYNNETNKEFDMKYNGELTPYKLVDGISKLVGYNIILNDATLINNKFIIDFNSLSAPFKIENKIQNQRFPNNYSSNILTETILNSIDKTLKKNFGDNVKTLYSLNDSSFTIDNTSINNQIPFQSTISKSLTGEYLYDNSSDNFITKGTLKITDIDSNSFDFSIEVVAGQETSLHNGLIIGTATYISDNEAVFTSQDGSKVTFNINRSDNSITINANEEAHRFCGLGVTFNLKYIKK